MNMPRCLLASATSSRLAWRSAEDHLWSQRIHQPADSGREPNESNSWSTSSTMSSAQRPATIDLAAAKVGHQLSQVGENGEMK